MRQKVCRNRPGGHAVAWASRQCSLRGAILRASRSRSAGETWAGRPCYGAFPRATRWPGRRVRAAAVDFAFAGGGGAAAAGALAAPRAVVDFAFTGGAAAAAG